MPQLSVDLHSGREYTNLPEMRGILLLKKGRMNRTGRVTYQCEEMRNKLWRKTDSRCEYVCKEGMCWFK